MSEPNAEFKAYGSNRMQLVEDWRIAATAALKIELNHPETPL